MIVYKIKRIPEGFSYIPSKRTVLDAIKKHGMKNISLVSFNGVSMTELDSSPQQKPQISNHHLGKISATRKYEGWNIEIEIVAIRDRNIGQDSSDIETVFLENVRIFQRDLEIHGYTQKDNFKEMFVQFKRNEVDGKVESTSFHIEQ